MVASNTSEDLFLRLPSDINTPDEAKQDIVFNFFYVFGFFSDLLYWYYGSKKKIFHY